MGIERVEAASGSGGAFFGVDQVAADGGNADIPYCKLMSGTDGATDVIPGDAANGLDVDVTRLPALVAGTAIIGKVGIDQTTPGTTNAVAIGDGGAVTLGAKADAKSTATDTTPITVMSVLKQISASVQAPPSQAVTNAGTFAVQVPATALSIGKAEDSASADGDVGVPAMAVRKATPANTSGTDGDYEPIQISVGRIWTSAKVDSYGGTRSYKTASGTLTADTDIVAAVTSKRIKVYALSLTTVGTNANAAIWKSNGAAGTELWRTLLQGASGQPMGERLAVAPGIDGAFLFATVAGEKLTLDVGNADTLHYSISYWDDDAT